MWRRRSWQLYFAARCISTGGSLFSWIGLPVLVFEATRSSAWTAAVASAQALPYLFLGLIAGQLADAVDRRVVMVTADAVSGCALASVPLASMLLGPPSPWHVLTVAGVVQSCFVFFDAANFGALPALVGRDSIARANGLLFSCSSVMECLVPPVAGLLIAVGDVTSLLTLDALSFLASALLTMLISSPMSAGAHQRGLSWAQVVEGLTYLWNHSLIRGLTLANLFVSLSNGAIAGQLVVWARDRLAIGPHDFRLGVMFGAMSVGGIVGGALTDPLHRIGKPRGVAASLCVLATLAAVATTWSSSLWVALPLLGVWEALSLAALLIGVTVRQELTPDRLMSRVNTTGRMLALGIGWPVGAFVAGWVSVRTGSPALGITAGIAGLPVAAALLAVRRRSTDVDVETQHVLDGA